ncbi:MAG: hypothetical protein K0U98_17785 [Deltaproteobacteria bacterium]|nr:hypothetical protein [Deltaproteobacteria bacterium]
MGLLGKLFKKDPAEQLERAKTLLERGRAVQALQVAEDVLRGGSPREESRAQSMVAQCHKAILDSALEEAARSKDAGFWEEAANWVDTALLHCSDPQEKTNLLALKEGYLVQSKVAEQPPPESFDDEEPEDFTDYEILVDLFTDATAARYRERSPAFEQAFQELAAGQAETALGVFEEEVQLHPEDPLPRLERGRCHLLLGDFEAAKRDFDVAWESLGDEPLDRAGSMSVPRLWGEAALALSGWEEVIERLKEVAQPAQEQVDLSLILAEALCRSERSEEALAFLQEAARTFPQVPQFTFLLAMKRQETGDVGGAIACLEANVELGCASGGCSGPSAIFAPSLSLLIRLYLDHEGPRDRLRGLLELLPYARNGALEVEDVALLQRFHDTEEDPQILSWTQESLYQWKAQARPVPVSVEAPS